MDNRISRLLVFLFIYTHCTAVNGSLKSDWPPVCFTIVLKAEERNPAMFVVTSGQTLK